jgi:transcriptional regulator of acetoin/glycerol metabolism
MQPTGYPIRPKLLEQCWHSFMETGRVCDVAGFAPDPAIIASWERCKLRLDPWSKPHLSRSKEQALETTLQTHADLLAVAIPYVEDIHQFIEGSDCAILLADGTACVLMVGGDQSARDMIDQLGLGQGTYCTEGQLGTIALGLVLITAMPVQVVGAEHFSPAYHHLVSTAAPIHDEHGRILGMLAIIGPISTATSHTLSLVMAAARAIGNQLQANLYLQEAIRHLTEVNVVLGAMNEGLIAWDDTGKINHINPRAGILLHLNPTTVQGQPLTDVLQLPPLMAEALQQRSELRDVEVSFDRVGQTINALVSLRPIVEGRTRLVGYIAILRPIEQVRQLVHQQVGAQASLTLQDISAASSDMRRVLRQATIAARGRAPVLLHGEGGVGKNALARAIHNAGGRAEKPFIAISCRAIPHELMIPEFLGYDPSDTGKGRPSKFELAHGGTLLLEQIESLSLEMQTALVHVIETGHTMRLRSTRLIPLDVRIIATTTTNLEQRVTEGSFIRQLYYAFGVFNFTIAPLRERVEDIPLLTERFLSRMMRDHHHEAKIDDEALAVLSRYPWPGNVRELENALEQAMNHSLDGTICITDLPEIVRLGRLIDATSPVPQPVLTTVEAEREAIIRAGWACQGRLIEMAQQLGIGRTTLWRKLKQLHITPDHFKRP